MCIINFLSSQLLANIIILITAFYAIKTYKSDVGQKMKTNTLEYITNFEYGNWISETDKSNWNLMFEAIERNCCGEMAFQKTFATRPFGNGDKRDSVDVIEIFSEGLYSIEGRSICSVMSILEFIAKEVLENKLDFDLINLKLLRFYQLADFYNDILLEDSIKNNLNKDNNSYPNITKLYGKLFKTFSNNKPYSNYCTFQLPPRFQPPIKAKSYR